MEKQKTGLTESYNKIRGAEKNSLKSMKKVFPMNFEKANWSAVN